VLAAVQNRPSATNSSAQQQKYLFATWRDARKGKDLSKLAARRSIQEIKSNQNQIFICSNERNEKIDNNSDNEQDSKAQEALTAALVNNSKSLQLASLRKHLQWY